MSVGEGKTINEMNLEELVTYMSKKGYDLAIFNGQTVEADFFPLGSTPWADGLAYKSFDILTSSRGAAKGVLEKKEKT